MPSSPSGAASVAAPSGTPVAPIVARRAPRAWIALLAALLALGLGAALAPAADAADRDFAPRFSANDTGDIDIVGNTLMTCPSSAPGCAAAQQAGVTTTADSSSQNNAYNMQYIDVDADASTFNSSRATVALPAGSTVLFAGLYWGARTAAGSGGQAARSIQDRNKIKLRVPGAAGYASLTADQLDDGSGGIYQGFKDVTSLVAGAGSGVYTAADVQASTGADTLAGWSLVIAYRDTGQPARNLTVFDGIKSIGGSQTGTIGISGFQTPPAGDVRTRVGFVTYEGDGGIVGDSASLNTTVLSDAQHPATNFFNSRSSRDGVRRTATEPNFPNQLGIEQSIIKADGVLANNATSATIRLTSSGDVYAPGVVTFATELYAPKIEQAKTVQRVNADGSLSPATTVEQGDTLRYTVAGRNVGQDGAANVVVRDPLPAGTSYVPGSIRVSPATTAGGTTTAGVTDATDADRGEYDAANRRVVARVGGGATGAAGGTIAVAGEYRVVFDVKVGGPSPAIASGARIDNLVTTSFSSSSLGTSLTAESTATTTVKTPDLTVAKTGEGSFTAGAPYAYLVTVRNAGDARSQGSVTVTDTLPAGLTPGAVDTTGTGWSCATSGRAVTCTRSDALAAGDAFPAIRIPVTVGEAVSAPIQNTAAVSGGGDGNTTNNTGSSTGTPSRRADLSLTKTAGARSAPVGGTVAYELEVRNGGPSRSTGSTVTDRLPAGLVFVSADAGCAGSAASGTVTCEVGPLAASATRTFTVIATPAAGTAGTTLRNTASVAGLDLDPDTTNDAGSATVDVRPVDLRITSAIQGAPSELTPGRTFTWQVDVTNLGGSSAPGTVVRFPVPAGTTVDGALPSGCALAADVITCAVGDVAPGASIPTIDLPLRVVGDDAPATIETTASVSTTETDVDPSNDTASTATPVATVARPVDLGVVVTSQTGAVRAGDDLRLTATVTNHGPGTPADPTVTIPLPLRTTLVSAGPGCALNGPGTAVVCALDPDDLAPGAGVATSIVVKVGPNPGTSISATATVRTSSTDTDPSNDASVTAVPVATGSGVSITKTASTTQAKPGDVVTYALTARNDGPEVARNVVIDDVVPAGTTFVSADDPCVASADQRAIGCELGDLPAGRSRAVGVRVRVNEIAGAFDAAASHQLVAVKKEADFAFEPRTRRGLTAEEQRQVTCDPGFVSTDGSVRIESVDQGTGTFADVAVRSSRQTGDGRGWTAEVDNRATGRAQAKVTVVCLQERTSEAGGHAHPLLVSPPVETTRQLVAGRQEVELTCGPGRVAIAPSYAFADGGTPRVLGSQRAGVSGWRFTVDAGEGTFAVRCLSTTTGVVDGHAHDLVLSQLRDTVTVEPSSSQNARQEKTLSCSGVGNGGKGIVGSSDIDDGLVDLGSDPQPINRVFRFHNPTTRALGARVGLLCLGDRTGGELGVQDVRNTASVSTTTPDADTADNVASAVFTATRASGDPNPSPAPPTPAPADPAPASPAPADPAPAAPAPAAPAPTVARATLLSSALRVTGSTRRATVAVPLRCARACSGTATLTAVSKIRGTRLRKGSVLGTVRVGLRAGTRATVRVVTRGSIAKAVRSGRVTRAKLVVTTGKGATVTRTVRLVRR